MDVLDAQQPPGVLGVDAAELREHRHDLQEQEPAGRHQERLGAAPGPHPPTRGPALKLHEFRGWGVNQDISGQPRGKAPLNSLSFSFILRQGGQNRRGQEGWTGTAIAPRPLGSSPCTQRHPWEHPGTADAKCIAPFWRWGPLPWLMAGAQD